MHLRADWGLSKLPWLSGNTWIHMVKHGQASCSAIWEVLCACPCQLCAKKQQRSSFMFIKAHWIPSSGVPTAIHMLPATPYLLCSFLLLKNKHFFSPPPTLSPLAWSTGTCRGTLGLSPESPGHSSLSTSVQREARPLGSSAGFVTLKMVFSAFSWWT